MLLFYLLSSSYPDAMPYLPSTIVVSWLSGISGTYNNNNDNNNNDNNDNNNNNNNNNNDTSPWYWSDLKWSNAAFWKTVILSSLFLTILKSLSLSLSSSWSIGSSGNELTTLLIAVSISPSSMADALVW